MAQIIYNIPELFRTVFGLYYPKYPTSPTLLGEDEASPDHAQSLMGTPIHDVVKFTSADNEILLLPDAHLFTVGRAKIIQKTRVQGYNGTVKEFIALDDYTIEFFGFVVNHQNNAYPRAEVGAMVDLFNKNESLAVTSNVLNDVFGIYNIVMEQADFRLMEAIENTQPFSIRCVSDDPIELIYKNLQ
jgi:hypothetical protein